MEKTLTSDEYEARIRNIRTPEDAALFAREIMLANTIDQREPAKRPERVVSRKREPSSLVHESETLSPWYDVIANDNEAMIVDLYAKGMTTRDIAHYMKSHYGLELSQPAISSITDKVYPLMKEWQVRPLASAYPIIYLDGLRFKIRDSGKVVPKVAYIAMGISLYGEKEVLGIWTSPTEGAKFWMQVMTDIKNRGVEDIFIACVDGLKGFPEAIKAIYPYADVQVCIAHQVRHTIMFLPQRDKRRFCGDLKLVYTAPNEETGKAALIEMMERWPQYKAFLRGWENRWVDLAPFFGYPGPIRRMIYTTNAIENLNRQFRKVTKTTTIFPHDESLLKLLWLAQTDVTQRWKQVHNWGEVMSQLAILFPERIHF